MKREEDELGEFELELISGGISSLRVAVYFDERDVS